MSHTIPLITLWHLIKTPSLCQTHTALNTHKLKHTQTQTQRKSNTDRNTQTHTHRQTERDTPSLIDTATLSHRDTDKVTDRQLGESDNHKKIHTHTQTQTEASRETESHTHTLTKTHTLTQIIKTSSLYQQQRCQTAIFLVPPPCQYYVRVNPFFYWR